MTLMGENDYGQAPSQSELMNWAQSYGLTHPVLQDTGFNVGWMALRDSKVWFVPHAGTLRHGQANIIDRFRKELASNHSVSFRLTPRHERVFSLYASVARKSLKRRCLGSSQWKPSA